MVNDNDYKDFTNVIDMFARRTVIKIKMTMSDDQKIEAETYNIIKALEYVADIAGKCFTNGTHISHVEMDDVGR